MEPFCKVCNFETWLQVLNTLEEIQERHDAVKEIEKKLLELKEVYLLLDLDTVLMLAVESKLANMIIILSDFW
jgi:syntaxin 1B/2/3